YPSRTLKRPVCCPPVANAPGSDSKGSPLRKLAAKLLQGGAHLGLYGPHRAAANLGDLVIGQLAVLPKEENFLFIRPQVHDGQPKPVEGFLVLHHVQGQILRAMDHDFVSRERPDAATPGAAFEVLGGVEADANNPGPQITDGLQAAGRLPALGES